MPATVTSDWPTPTVSTSTTSYAAASSTSIAWVVARATPPSVPALGRGPDVGVGSADSSAIRVLSPSTEPPVRTERRVDGEHADPVAVAGQLVPRVSMNVDLPTPGTPEMPTRTAPPAAGRAESATGLGERGGAHEY